MRRVKLGEICRIVSGATPRREIKEYWGGSIPWVTPKEISLLKGAFLEDSVEKITQAGFKACSTEMLPIGSLLMSSRAPIGLFAINKIPVCTNQGFKSFITSKKVDVLFLYYILKYNVRQLKAKGNGATFKELSKVVVEKFTIPLPPLEDQVCIATLLSRVEALISTRKDNLRLLDEFLKSTFLEMFGIKSGEYKGWKLGKLVRYAEIVSGVTKGKRYKNEDLIEIPYMRVANVQDGYFNLEEIKTIHVTQLEIEKYALVRGDILLTEGGDPDKLGRGSVWEGQIKRCIHQNHIFRVRVSDWKEANPYYLSALIGSIYGKSYFLKAAKQTTGIASINSTQLKGFPLIIPPIDLQNDYAAIANKMESLKTLYQQSLNELENLYGTLSQKAFKDELDLSRIP